jgi:hypothetical protein
MRERMADTAEHPPQPGHAQAAPTAGNAKHVHHGRTLAAWVGTTIAMIAIVLGGIAVVLQIWPLFWVGVGLLVLSLIVTKVLQVMGHGAY